MSFSTLTSTRIGSALPCFLWGTARTGTNLICWALEKADGIQCFNEDRPEAFQNYFLRSNVELAQLIESCPQGKIFFKAHADTPRAQVVMDFFPNARAIYTIRQPDHAIASFGREFGDMGFEVWQRWFSEAAAGKPGPVLDLTASSRDLYDHVRRSAADAAEMLERYGRTHRNVAALYYLWQNAFHAPLLDRYPGRLITIDYDQLVNRPRVVFDRITTWFDCGQTRFDLAAIHKGSGAPDDMLGLADELRQQCWALYRQMLNACEASAAVRPSWRLATKR